MKNSRKYSASENHLMNQKVDLHLHTNYSDGFLSPFQLLQKVKNEGIDCISITDHDSVSAIEEAASIGNEIGVEVIAGVEISSDVKDKEIHILGYFVEPGNSELERYLNFFREERIKRAERIVIKINNLGMPLKIDDVLELAKNSTVGRPHIAQIMLEKGFVNSYYEAFNKYLGNDCPAYERKVHVSPKSAFKIINDAGGLSFIAHPGYLEDNLLKELIEAGVDGIEVIHPSNSAQQTKFYKGIANEYFLLESGGSDFHGGKREDDRNLGKFCTNYSTVEAMRKRLMKNSA